MSKSKYRKINIFLTIMIMLLSVMIYQEVTNNTYSNMFVKNNTGVMEYSDDDFYVYQCPAGTIVIEFEMKEIEK